MKINMKLFAANDAGDRNKNVTIYFRHKSKSRFSKNFETLKDAR